MKFLWFTLASQSLVFKAYGLEHWLYSSPLDNATMNILERVDDLVGVQSLYSWKSLEPAQGEYNFTALEDDFARVRAKGKKFWVQLQDRSFSPQYDPVPSYLKTPYYNNGSAPTCDGENCAAKFTVNGSVAQQWNPRVRERFQALLSAMAAKLDNRIYGINLAETSIEVDHKSNNYSDEDYFRGSLENAAYARSVFNHSHVVQYMNFWPDGWGNAKDRFNTSFDFLAKHNVGVGGPDLIPFKPGQENNSYRFIRAYHDRLPITVVAVQEPTLKEENPYTHKPFTKAEFVDYAEKNLSVSIIFWATTSPWLLEATNKTL
ncbi:hypothetical protein JDV02_005077 [Purpureocillium takamizusanense]|uniref:Uncharacterized protein n=1 Tax=Purpureocillium takamizusanense TaxID=2060973 RepID=A0A9Q8VBE0_9HYPO|nr:uncharacterized protein JDV02_005077 [Purpureocillium takamizusanense]UNI18831.1 hypothetical protein JDV02_005077 [Purpureocillium takamizusanense]